MAQKKFYIKQRHNPQFKQPYYVAMGQLTKKEANSHENSKYGTNIMLSYDSEDQYNVDITSLKETGCNVQ